MFAFLYFSQMTSQDALKLSNAFLKTIGYLFLFILFGLFLDSKYFIQNVIDTQWLADISMFIGFAVVYFKATQKMRQLMVHAVIIGIIGEYLFSIVLGIYTYRLGNIPHYVPPGHALVLVATMCFCKKSIVKLHKKWLEKIFGVLIFSYGLLFLIFANDIFGFVMTLLVLFLLRNKPRERLFYYSMYIVVAFLEIVGTNYGCWFWPETAWGTIPFLKSSNPPSGISLFYFLLDLGSLWIYKQRHNIAWARMKNIRKLNAFK